MPAISPSSGDEAGLPSCPGDEFDVPGVDLYFLTGVEIGGDLYSVAGFQDCLFRLGVAVAFFRTGAVSVTVSSTVMGRSTLTILP